MESLLDRPEMPPQDSNVAASSSRPDADQSEVPSSPKKDRSGTNKVPAMTMTTQGRHQSAESAPSVPQQDAALQAAEKGANESDQAGSARTAGSTLKHTIGWLTGKSPAELEISRLQDEIQSLKDGRGKLVRDRNRLKEECKILSNQVESLRRSRQDKYDDLVRERDSLSREKIELRNRLHNVSRDLQAEEEAVRTLQHQVTYYKTNISSATRIPDQMADDIVKSRTDDVFRSMQNFVVRHFRGCSFEHDLLPEELKRWMDDYVPFAHVAAKEHWLNIAISVIAKTLTDRATAYFYFGLSDDGPINAAGNIARQLKPEEILEHKSWLESTRRLIGLRDTGALSEAQDRLVRHMTQEVQHTIAKAMKINWTVDMEQQLATIFHNGLELLRTLQRQQASFHLRMAPAYDEDALRINPITMEDVHGADEDDTLKDRWIEISVFPLVYKLGDERGERQDEVTIISRAKVVPVKRPAPLRRQRRDGRPA